MRTKRTFTKKIIHTPISIVPNQSKTTTQSPLTPQLNSKLNNMVDRLADIGIPPSISEEEKGDAGFPTTKPMADPRDSVVTVTTVTTMFEPIETGIKKVQDATERIDELLITKQQGLPSARKS